MTFWWLLFLAALGLCIGSFLNVVAYRLPRGQSVWEPRWSACPSCGHPIRWRDNLPVVSFIVLRGRCRDCRQPISTQYPIIELLTALLLMLLFGAFFVAQTRAGIAPQTLTYTWQIGHDWPIFLAHIILFAALFAMSVIDLEHYWVDIRFTNLAALCGFILHMLWTPRSSLAWVRPWDETATVCVAMLLGLAATYAIMRIMYDPPEFVETPDPEHVEQRPGSLTGGETVVVQASGLHDTAETSAPQAETVVVQASGLHGAAGTAPPQHSSRVYGILAAAGLAAALLAILVTELLLSWQLAGMALFVTCSALGLALIFVLIVCAGLADRASDEQIVAAIEAERASARGMALRELMLLSPAILAGGAALALLWHGVLPMQDIKAVIHWSPVGDWQPLLGLRTATAGYIIGGAIGWGVRIIFTLVLGKEAFGVGDIHMMAAAGAVAGWPVVALGFFAAVFLALLAWILSLPIKRARAIPLGPWLSLGFLIVVLFYDAIAASPYIASLITMTNWLLFSHE
jgi:prepilin signal peptidase PulO-like enzyme (type II secretory pathway)